jgi:GT2 family glycosyltransferase/peptidoglycan/xylan/chitin deacetylase (PgdA/CDA1 family)
MASGREPSISVVIPAYNAAATLAETLASVSAQDCDDWEAIVVDDGSTDGTAAVALNWTRKDPRFRIARQPNAGLSAARNHGIRLARGRFLVFLDADDWLGHGQLTGFLEARARQPDADVLYGTFARVASDGTTDRPKRMHDLSENAFRVFADRSAGAIHSFMASKAVVEAAGGFDTSLATCEDWDFWQRVARRGARFAGAPHVVARYRMRQDSMSSNLIQMLGDAREVIERARRPLEGEDSVPEYAAGADRSSMPMAIGTMFLWLAARGAAIGKTMPDMDLVLPEPPKLADACDWLVDVLQDGMLVGAAAPPSDAAALWSAAAPDLVRILSHWGEATGDPVLAESVVYALERRILRSAPLSEPVLLTRWAGFRVDVGKPIPSLPLGGGIHAVHCRVYGGRDLLRTIEFPVFGPLSSAEVTRFIIDEIGGMRPYFMASRMAFRPSFWVNVAIESARKTEPNETEDSPASDRAHRILHRAVYRTSSSGAEGHAASTANVVEPAWRRASNNHSLPLPHGAAQVISAADQVCSEIPVLLYNHIGGGRSNGSAVSFDAFRRQMDFLSSSGYRAISPHDLQQAKRKKAPLIGRPVLITFSRPHADLFDLVAPVLDDAGFTALVFVPPDCIGRGAQRERALMGWQELVDLKQAGYWFGSSLTSRAAVAALPSRLLLEEAHRSRAMIEDRLDVRVDTVAPPFGPCDERTHRIFHLAGYTQIFSPRDGLCDLRRWSLDAPQIEVLPEDTLRTFVERIGDRGSVPHVQ